MRMASLAVLPRAKWLNFAAVQEYIDQFRLQTLTKEDQLALVSASFERHKEATNTKVHSPALSCFVLFCLVLFCSFFVMSCLVLSRLVSSRLV
jgi:hypothetical protein